MHVRTKVKNGGAANGAAVGAGLVPARKNSPIHKIRDDSNYFRDYSGGHKTRPYNFGGRFATAVRQKVQLRGKRFFSFLRESWLFCLSSNLLFLPFFSILEHI